MLSGDHRWDALGNFGEGNEAKLAAPSGQRVAGKAGTKPTLERARQRNGAR
jgi:hypothetical protein